MHWWSAVQYPLQLNHQHESQKLPACESSPNLRILLVQLYEPASMFPIAFYWVMNPWTPITALGKSIFQQPFKVTDFIIHAFLYIYYAVSNSVQFPALSKWNKGLHTCSENSAEGTAAHVMALECCDSSLVK